MKNLFYFIFFFNILNIFSGKYSDEDLAKDDKKQPKIKFFFKPIYKEKILNFNNNNKQKYNNINNLNTLFGNLTLNNNNNNNNIFKLKSFNNT